MSVSSAAQEAIWLRHILQELDFKQEAPTIIYEDNQSCISMSKTSGQHDRTKHIDIKHHFIREQVEAGALTLAWVPTETMIADILTKPLNTPQFEAL